MNLNHDPFVLKLPPEVGSHILVLAMREMDTAGGVINEPKGSPTPFLFGAICKGWRELAWSTPELWTRIAFTFNDFKNSKNMDALISEWLDRSCGLPLTLKFYYVTYVSYTSELHQPVIDALNRHSERWYDVDFNLPSHCFHLLYGTSHP